MDNFFSRRPRLTAILVLILLSTIPYINTLANDFVYDDIPHIVENDLLRDPSNLFKIIQGPRSIKYISLLAEYQIWGLNPFWYHLTNLILHILSTISLYFLLSRIFLNHRIPLITGLLFAVHPVHTEAVTAIANRHDLLAMFFFIWSFTFYIMRERSIWLYVLSVISFLLAILSKDAAVLTLPVILILYDLYFSPLEGSFASKRRLRPSKQGVGQSQKPHPNLLTEFTKEDRWIFIKKNSWYYAPYGLIIIFIFYLMFTFRIFPSTFEPAILFLQSLPIFYTACRAFLTYIKLLFIPLNLSVDYILPLSQSFFELNVLVSLTSLILFLILIIRIYHSSKAISFGMVWFFITLFPLSNLLFPVSYFVAERYLYLPSVGFCLIIAVIIERFGIERETYKKMTICLLTVILSLYSGLTIDRNLDWRSNYTLWSRTVKQSPVSPTAHNNLGIAYIKKGLLDQAEAEFREAMRIRPDDPEVHNNLGNIYMERGFLDQAIEEYKEAMRIRPDDPEVHNNLGNIYLKKRLLDQAIEEYKEAIKVRPDYALAHDSLGTAYRKKGLLDQAEAEFKEVIRIRPDDPVARNNLGNIYMERGFLDQAIEEYKEALKMDHVYTELHYNLGLAYDRKGLWNQAINHYQRFLKLASPNHREAIVTAKGRIRVLMRE